MSNETGGIRAARQLTAQVASRLRGAPEFEQLAPAIRESMLNDLAVIRKALETGSTCAAPAPDASAATLGGAVPHYAAALDTPDDLRRRLFERRSDGARPTDPASNQTPVEARENGTVAKRTSAADAFARRVGESIDEINFPDFVAGLVNGTFDAMVDSAIRQMEAFADLVSAVARDSDDFTNENVTANQARDWLVEHYPGDVELRQAGGTVTVAPRQVDEFSDGPSPSWLNDFGLAGEALSMELIEEQIIPQVRDRVGENRLHMLATMVLMGMNRIVVRDGSITAKMRFRATARDKAAVDYAVSQDPGGLSSWGNRGSESYVSHSTMISTVGTNVQSDTNLRAELFGEIKINFVSETLPLERFADQAALALVQRNALVGSVPAPTESAPAAPALPAVPGTAPPVVPPTPVATAPAPPAPAPATPSEPVNAAPPAAP